MADFASWGLIGLLPQFRFGVSLKTDDTRVASDRFQISSMIVKYELIKDMNYASMIDFHSFHVRLTCVVASKWLGILACSRGLL